jgi:hypothetical protein
VTAVVAACLAARLAAAAATPRWRPLPQLEAARAQVPPAWELGQKMLPPRLLRTLF